MPIAKLSEAELYYEVDGPEDAPVVVLSNSLGTDLTLWDAQISIFAQEFKVIRYDTRGHGRSGAPAGTYSLGQLAHDVLELLDALDIEQTAMCGISLGGMTALWLAIHAPQRVRWIVVANTAAKIGSSAAWNERIETIERSGMEAIGHSVPQRWLTEEFRNQNANVLNKCERMLHGTSAHGYVGCCCAIRDMDLTSKLETIHLPTLVISGQRDTVTTTADARVLVEAIAGAKHVELGGAHLSNLECAANFNAAVMDFARTEERR